MNVSTPTNIERTLKLLKQFLDEINGDDGLDFYATQGFISAISVVGSSIPDHEWPASILDKDTEYTTELSHTQVFDHLINLRRHIESMLYSDEGLELPWSSHADQEMGMLPDGLDDTNDDWMDIIQPWCIGFMEGVFSEENQWFSKHNEDVSQLLIPIMACSGLFDEEEEFKDLTENQDMLWELAQKIPETLVSLFLLFHVPENE